MIFFSKNNSFDNKTLWDFLKIIHLIEISFRKINDKKWFFLWFMFMWYVQLFSRTYFLAHFSKGTIVSHLSLFRKIN